MLAQSIIIYCIVLPHSDDSRVPLLPAKSVPDAEQHEGTVCILYITILACALLYMDDIVPFSVKFNQCLAFNVCCKSERGEGLQNSSSHRE